MEEDPLQPPVSDETLLRIGPVLVGALLSWMLLGVCMVQLYIYYVSFPSDRLIISVSVYAIFLLDIVQSVVVAGQTWEAVGTGWGRPINLQYPGWSITGLPLVSSVIAIWVQLFYAWRIHRLSGWRVVPISIIATALAQAAAAWFIAISFIWLKDINSLHKPNMSISNIIWLGGSAFTDVLIMISMLYLFYRVKKQSVRLSERSELLARQLIRGTVETGCTCALVAVLELVFFLALPDTNIHLTFGAILSKVYSNTLMASLNARTSFSHRRQQPPHPDDSSSRVELETQELRISGIHNSPAFSTAAIHISYGTGESDSTGIVASPATTAEKISTNWETMV